MNRFLNGTKSDKPFFVSSFSDTAIYDEITATIADRQNRKATIEQFLHTLSEQEQMVESFDKNLWCGLVDYVTVYTSDDIRVTFRNGTEIQA